MPLLAGTSGWQYRDWRGQFYPAGLGPAGWLSYYAQTFPAVENNGTFYRLAAPGTFDTWRAATPDGFVMAVKASRYLTHIRKLAEHFKKFHFVRRRPHKTRGPHADPDDEVVVFYDLTPTGKRMLKLVEGIEGAKRGEKRSGGK